MCASHTAVVPRLALTVVANSAAADSAKTSCTRLMSRRQRRRTRISRASSASAVFPVAMIRLAQIGTPVMPLTVNAARNTAGQRLRPRKQIAAIATPVGGHTVVATPASASNERPTRAVAT